MAAHLGAGEGKQIGEVVEDGEEEEVGEAGEEVGLEPRGAIKVEE